MHAAVCACVHIERSSHEFTETAQREALPSPFYIERVKLRYKDGGTVKVALQLS